MGKVVPLKVALFEPASEVEVMCRISMQELPKDMSDGGKARQCIKVKVKVKVDLRRWVGGGVVGWKIEDAVPAAEKDICTQKCRIQRISRRQDPSIMQRFSFEEENVSFAYGQWETLWPGRAWRISQRGSIWHILIGPDNDRLRADTVTRRQHRIR